MVKEWNSVLIGDFLEFKNGLNKGKEFFGQGTPIVNYTDVYHKRGLYAEDIKGKVDLTRDEIKRYEVRKNDVFFTRTSETPEEVGLTSVMLDDIQDCVFSGFVLRGRPKNELFDPAYCRYCFSTKPVRDAIVLGCTYTTRALTNGKQLSLITIPCPEIDEQKAIASALTDIDNLIVSLEELIEKKKNIRQGILHDLLTGTVRISNFEKNWEEVSIDSCGHFVSGNCFPLNFQGNQTGKYPFYKVSDFNNPGNEKFMYKANNYVSADVAVHLACNIIPANAILFAKIGAAIFLERKKMTTTECCIDNNMMAFLPYGNVSNRFIWLVFQNLVLGALVEATALPSLSAKSIGEVVVRIPTEIEEQEAIARVVLDMDSEIKLINDKLEKYKQIKQGMMSELLTGRIRLV